MDALTPGQWCALLCFSLCEASGCIVVEVCKEGAAVETKCRNFAWLGLAARGEGAASGFTEAQRSC